MTSAPAERVVDALIAAELVDPASRAASITLVSGVLEEPPPSGTRRRAMPQIVEVVGYLGGALVLAAGALFLFEQWGGLEFGARVGVLAVATVVLLVAGVVAARVPADGPDLRDEANDVRRRLAGSLLTFAGLGAALLVGHLVEHSMASDFPEVYWPVVLGAVVGTVVGAVGYRVAPTAVGLVGTIIGAVTTTTTLVDAVDRYEADAAGIALFLLGALWLGLTERGWFREPMVARALGVTVVLVGAQVPVMDGTDSWWGYLLTVLVAVAGIALYLRLLAWPYLAGAVAAVTLVVPEAVADWTDGSLGAVGGVLLAGVTLLVASFAGFRIKAEVTD